MAESAECYPKGNKPTKPQHHNTNYQNIQHPSQGQSTSTTVEFGVTLNFSNKSSDRQCLFQEAYCKALYANMTQGLKTQVLEPVREVNDPNHQVPIDSVPVYHRPNHTNYNPNTTWRGTTEQRATHYPLSMLLQLTQVGPEPGYL
ncbi:hypothetical protein FB45DRAFT_868130 [Roridomyces roridus]|uniref:Uncharacterized protein n=1 Tax=Roridomyces roridus TaxID=1738132 RepID=A0AAD7BP73_9AGAR|nr:hypothetical protein FB45DRAFT_868130 [Roridomyces roridus]